jgi:TolB protein
VDGNRDLWRVALDGGDLVRLTDDPSDDSDPTVAAGRIVFVSFRADRNNELWSMPVAGGAATRLTRTGGNESMPALSRDGQRLAFIYDITGLPKLWTSSGDGGSAARASATFGGDYAIDASPSWAPDGSRLAFTSTAEGTADIFSIAPPSAPSLLAGGGSTDVDAAFSPDGQFLAFSSDRAGGTDLYLMALSSGVVTRLTTSAGSEGQAAWTADGRLVFTEFVAAGGQLRYIDLAAPTVVRAIATGPGSARNPAAIP